MNSWQIVDEVESKLIMLIQEHYSQGGLKISLAEIYIQCRSIDSYDLVGDYIILHHILRRVKDVIPSHKWNRSHLIHTVFSYSDEIVEAFCGSKKEIIKQFKDYIK